MKKTLRIFNKDNSSCWVAVILLILTVGIMFFVYRFSNDNQYRILMLSEWGNTLSTLQFSYKTCHDPGPDIYPKVVRYEWLRDGSLIIQLDVASNCATRGFNGSYALDDDRLLLQYVTERNSVDACVCSTELVYKIRNLERKEYSVMICDTGMINNEGYHAYDDPCYNPDQVIAP